MKIHLIRLPVLVLLIIFTNYKTFSNNELRNKKSISENTEWSHTYMVSTSKNELPRVLIIGDSQVERYYPIVAEKLGNLVYCCKFTTSRSLGDPAFLEQLKVLFFCYRFDVISFNNGLHGPGYSEEQYSKYIPVVYKLLKRKILD